MRRRRHRKEKGEEKRSHTQNKKHKIQSTSISQLHSHTHSFTFIHQTLFTEVKTVVSEVCHLLTNHLSLTQLWKMLSSDWSRQKHSKNFLILTRWPSQLNLIIKSVWWQCDMIHILSGSICLCCDFKLEYLTFVQQSSDLEEMFYFYLLRSQRGSWSAKNQGATTICRKKNRINNYLFTSSAWMCRDFEQSVLLQWSSCMMDFSYCDLYQLK